MNIQVHLYNQGTRMEKYDDYPILPNYEVDEGELLIQDDDYCMNIRHHFFTDDPESACIFVDMLFKKKEIKLYNLQDAEINLGQESGKSSTQE